MSGVRRAVVVVAAIWVPVALYAYHLGAAEPLIGGAIGIVLFVAFAWVLDRRRP